MGEGLEGIVHLIVGFRGQWALGDSLLQGLVYI